MELPTRIVTAGTDGEGIAWVIIAIVWFVAQIISKLSRKGKGPVAPRPTMAPPTNVEDTLREFLESLEGAVVEEKDVPPPPPPPPPRMVQQAPPPPRSTQQSQKEYKRKLQEKHRGKQLTSRGSSSPIHPTPSVPQVVIDDLSRRTMKTRQLGSLSLSMPSLKSAQLPIGGFGSLSGKADQRTVSLKPDFKGSASVRKAIISRIVLGPPKAMETNADPVVR